MQSVTIKIKSLWILMCLMLIGCGASGGSNPTPSDEPTIFDDFVSNSGIWQIDERIASGVLFGANVAAASNGKALKIALPGDPASGTSEAVGPSAGNQVRSQDSLSYGEYRFSIVSAACAPSLDRPEEVITGAFVYSYGGDRNGNGLTDNDEIDFEFACSAPHLAMMTVWTDYDEESGEGRKLSRIVDMRNGRYRADGEPTEAAHDGTLEGPFDSTFDSTAAFHEFGFRWDPSEVLFFYSAESGDVVLWRMDDPTYVPRPTAPFMMNVWHAPFVWFVSQELFDAKGSWEVPAYYPAAESRMLADWFEYREM